MKVSLQLEIFLTQLPQGILFFFLLFSSSRFTQQTLFALTNFFPWQHNFDSSNTFNWASTSSSETTLDDPPCTLWCFSQSEQSLQTWWAVKPIGKIISQKKMGFLGYLVSSSIELAFGQFISSNTPQLQTKYIYTLPHLSACTPLCMKAYAKVKLLWLHRARVSCPLISFSPVDSL